MSEISDFRYFEIVANTAIQCNETILSEVLRERGIDRSNWPKPWPLIADNPHGTLPDVVVRIAMAAVAETEKQRQSFTAGWADWLKRCPQPLTTVEEIEDRTGVCICR